MDFNLLKEIIKKSEHTFRSCAEKAEMSETGFRQSLDRGTISVIALEKVCALLGVSPSLFFNDSIPVSVSGNKNHIGGIGNGNHIIFTSPEVKALRQRIKDLEQIISTQKETITSQLKTIELLTKNK